MAAPVGCTLLFHGQKCCTWYVSRKLRFPHYISRTLFFRMTYMPRKPVTNLNAFQKSGEVFNDLWFHTTAPLLNNDVKSCDRNIIPNRTQIKNPSFELGFWILHNDVSEFRISTFRNPQNPIFKGLEPQNCPFSGNLRNPTKPKFGWVIWMA